MSKINPAKLHWELERAGIPIVGVCEDGRIDFKPEATAAQRDQAAQILVAHNPGDPVQEERTRLARLDQLEQYVALQAPTNAQTVATVRLIIRVIIWIVRNRELT